MKPSTVEKIKRFFCSHNEKDVKFYRGKFWGSEDALASILGGNALKWEKCKKCGVEWESEWFLPTRVAQYLEEKP